MELAQPTVNPALGVTIFALGGLAGAVFYLPFKKVKNWAWESYWLIYAVVGLVIVPWVLALGMSPNVLTVIKNSPGKTLGYCFACGAMWGVGGLTWGLMIRYLGVGLGLAIGCGLCSAAGTLIPPIKEGDLSSLYGTPAANATLIGVLVSLVGIVLVGLAGMSKEKELPEEAKKKAVAEYNFKKGILVAIFSGIMSAGMSFGLQGGGILETLACPLFTAGHFEEKKLPELVTKLQKTNGEMAKVLWNGMSPKAKEQLQAYVDKKAGADDAKATLADEFNRVLLNGASVDLKTPVGLASLLIRSLPDPQQPATPEVRLRLCRYLIEQAFPKEIAQSPQRTMVSAPVTSSSWRGMPVLVVVLLGGFAVNFGWCLYLNFKNQTLGDYRKAATPLMANLFFAGAAGAIWCSQFICFKTGEPAMGKTAYVGWAVLMASAILFSTLLGIFLGEWKGTGGRTRGLLGAGLALLLASSVIAGYSGSLKESKPAQPATPASTNAVK